MEKSINDLPEFEDFPPGTLVTYNGVDCSVRYRSGEHTVDLKRLRDEATFPAVIVSRIKKSQ